MVVGLIKNKTHPMEPAALQGSLKYVAGRREIWNFEAIYLIQKFKIVVSFLLSGEESDFQEKVYFEDHLFYYTNILY